VACQHTEEAKLVKGTIIRRDRLERAVSMAAGVLAVTGASHLWHLLQACGPTAVLAVYFVSAFLLLAGARAVFCSVVQRAYQRERRLTSLAFFLQIVIWGMYFAFPYIYNPFDWAWSSAHGSRSHAGLWGVGWACVALGLVVLAIAIAWLGWPRSSGQGSKALEISGPYRVTRNPQLVGCLLLVTGYVVLWPSWYALGWLALYAGTAHMMVLAEEGYLRAAHGELYEQYRRRVPRYLGFHRQP
jgi:protein-S-isoprenylcysteine O-methyltransferase Ste14